MDTSKIAGAEREAGLTRLKRELSLAEQRNQDLNELNIELRNDNDELTRTLQNRARREGESTILIDRLNNLRQQLRDVERMRDSFKKETQVLQLDLKDAREQLNAQINATTADNTEVLKLQQELEQQRQTARQQLAELQEELDKAIKAADSHAANSEQALELEALRQENTRYQQQIGDRLRELQTSQETGQLLEDELEDANREIDELRRQLEKQEERLLHAQHNLTAAKASGQSMGDIFSQPQLLKIAGLGAVGGFLLAMLVIMLMSFGDSAETEQATGKEPTSVSIAPGQSSSGQIIRK